MAVSPVQCNSFTFTWTCSVHLLLGRPISLYIGCYSNSSLGKRVFSIYVLKPILLVVSDLTCCAFLMQFVPVDSVSLFIPHCEPREGPGWRISAAFTCFCSVLLILQSSRPWQSVAFEIILWNIYNRSNEMHFLMLFLVTSSKCWRPR